MTKLDKRYNSVLKGSLSLELIKTYLSVVKTGIILLFPKQPVFHEINVNEKTSCSIFIVFAFKVVTPRVFFIQGCFSYSKFLVPILKEKDI